MMIAMTQLFDTATYEDLATSAPAVEDSTAGRHLHSMPAGNDLLPNSTQWRLDPQTIEAGRRGIKAARQALQAAAVESHQRKVVRKAA